MAEGSTMAARARRVWREVIAGRDNGVTAGLLGGYFLVSFVQTFPMLSFTEYLTYVLSMEQTEQSYYYAVGFLPWGLKPIYAYLLQYVPIIAKHRRKWVAGAMLIAGSCYVFNALVVRSIAGAFATALASNFALAFVELALGGWLVDCAHRNMTNAGAVQAAATAARNAGSLVSCVVQLVVYPCHNPLPVTPAPLTPEPTALTASPMPPPAHQEEPSLMSWKWVMFMNGMVAIAGTVFAMSLPGESLLRRRKRRADGHGATVADDAAAPPAKAAEEAAVSVTTTANANSSFASIDGSGGDSVAAGEGHRLRTQQNLWIIAVLVAFQGVTVWATITVPGIANATWWGVLVAVIVVFFVVLRVAYTRVVRILLRLRVLGEGGGFPKQASPAHYECGDRVPSPVEPAGQLAVSPQDSGDSGRSMATQEPAASDDADDACLHEPLKTEKGAAAKHGEIIVVRDENGTPRVDDDAGAVLEVDGGDPPAPVLRWQEYTGPLAVAIFLFLFNATPTAGVQYGTLKYMLFRHCDLVHFSIIEYAASTIGAVMYTPLANRRRIAWVLPVFTMLSFGVSLLQIPISRVDPSATDKRVDVLGVTWELSTYNYVVTIVGSLVGSFAFIPLQVLATEQTPRPYRLLVYAIFLSFLDCGATAREWVTAPIVSGLGIQNSDFSNLYVLMLISGASSLVLSLLAPFVVQCADAAGGSLRDDHTRAPAVLGRGHAAGKETAPLLHGGSDDEDDDNDDEPNDAARAADV